MNSKQKGPGPSSPGIKEPKMKKPQMSNCSHTQTQTQSQPLSELIARTQRINPIANDNLDELLQIWNEAKENPVTLSQDQIRLNEMEKYLEQIEKRNQNLCDKISLRKSKNEKLAKYIEQKFEAGERITEKQNDVSKISSMLREHIKALADEVGQTQEGFDHLEGLYDDVNSIGLEKTKTLTDRLNDQVSKNKILEMEFNSKCEEFTIAQLRCEEVESEIKRKTEKINKATLKLEESKAMIGIKQKEFSKQMAEKIAMQTILEQNLKIAQEENCKIDAEYNRTSKENAELVSTLEALKAEDAASASEVESLKSNLLELKEREAKLNKELDEVNNTRLALVANGDSESAVYRTRLQDLMSKEAEVSGNLEKANSDGEELSKTLANATAHKEQLRKSVEIKDNEIKILRTKVNDASNKKNVLLTRVKNLKEELTATENQLLENRADFKKRRAERDENREKKATAIRAELAAAKQLLSDRSDQLTKQMEKAQEIKIQTSKELMILEEDILRKRRLLNQEQRYVVDLKSKKSEKELETQKTMMSPKQCEVSGHVKQMKENEREIKALEKQLLAEKLKLKQLKLKNKEAERKDNEKCTTQKKKNKSRCGDLKKKLVTLDKEIADLTTELESTEASNAAKNAREASDVDQLIIPTDADHETIPTASSHKSILKLGAKSPLKVQKVQFDIESPSQSQLGNVDSLSVYEKARRENATRTTIPDWAKMGLPSTSQQIETPSSAIDTIPATQTNKSMLKLGLKDRKSPLSAEKVQSDSTLGKKLDVAAILEKARREYATSPNKPDWGKISLPTSLQQQETPSPAVDAIPARQMRKPAQKLGANDIHSKSPSTTQKAQVGTVSSSQSFSKLTNSSDAEPKQPTAYKFFKSKGSTSKGKRFAKK